MIKGGKGYTTADIERFRKGNRNYVDPEKKTVTVGNSGHSIDQAAADGSALMNQFI